MPPVGRLLALALLLPVIAACSSAPSGSPAAGSASSRSPASSGDAADPCAPWGCAQQARFDAAAAFIATQQAHVGIVVKDRMTGAVWSAGDPALRTWAGSTPKLALAVALKEQTRALDAAANADIDAMLYASDNNAATRLWNRYVDSDAMMKRWQDVYGMTTASYVDFQEHHWGWVKLTPQDLVNLMTYVLETLDPTHRAYIVDRMRAVAPNQQWGVWGAGSAWAPGVKNGWDRCAEMGEAVFRWIVSTVGFVGPAERYVVAAMYDRDPEHDSKEAAVHGITDLIAIVFGATVPAPAVVPPDD
jgi:hypothetical protein